MKLKRLLLIIPLSGALAGCHVDEVLDTGSEAQPTSTKRTRAEAITEVRTLWKELNSSQTMVPVSIGGPRIARVDMLSRPFTKGDEYQLDSLAYIINFENDEGYAVVRMDKDCSPIVALTERGNLDVGKLFNPAAEFENPAEEIVYWMIENGVTQPSGTSATKGGWTPGFGPNAKEGEEPNVWYTDTLVHPKVHTKWGQGYPFNMYMPYCAEVDTTNKQKQKTGCTVVAATQLMVATGHPLTYQGNLFSFQIPSLYGVSNYSNYVDYKPQNYDSNVPAYMKNWTMKVADLMHTFGQQIEVTYDESGSTFGSIDKVMKVLDQLDHSYFKDKKKVDIASADAFNYCIEIDSLINVGKPVLIRGERITDSTKSDSGISKEGHAWLVDGYMYRHINYGYVYSQMYHLYHFNFGWQGNSDGFYDALDISTLHRKMRDPIYDTNPSYAGNGAYRYDMYYYSY